MPQEKSITAILIAYNSAAVIGLALRPLLQAPAVSHIIVVDNCSHDDTCELIQQQFPSVELIENPKNEGFSRASNTALNKVQSSYALLVSPDIVLPPNVLEQLAAAAQRYPDAAVIAPQLCDEQGRPCHNDKQGWFEREELHDAPLETSGDACVDFLSNGLWLVNMKQLRTVGFFDPEIIAFYEAHDLCLRIRKHPYSLVLLHDAKVTRRVMHQKGGTMKDSQLQAEYTNQRNIIWSRLYVENKHNGSKAANSLANRLHLEYSFKAAICLVTGMRERYNYYRGRMKGIADFRPA